MNQEALNNQICKQHSGLIARLKTLEDNVSKLWVKWDKFNAMLITAISLLCLNLLAGLFIIAFK